MSYSDRFPDNVPEALKKTAVMLIATGVGTFLSLALGWLLGWL